MRPPIDPASDLLKEHTWATGGAVAYLALALAVPGIVVLVAGMSSASLDDWLTHFRPVVYLERGASMERAEELGREIEQWGVVSGVRVRSPAEGMRDLRERLGEAYAGELELDREMFPATLVVKTGEVSAGRADIAARLSALSARKSVVRVDVPSAAAVRALDYLGWGRIGGMLLGLALVAAAAGGVARYLDDLREVERDRLAVLDRLGAPPRDLQRRPRLRGAIIGGWAGLGAALMLSLAGVVVGVVVADLAPGRIGGAAWLRWLVTLAPLLLGPAIGFGVGYWVSSRDCRGAGRVSSDGLRSALRYD